MTQQMSVRIHYNNEYLATSTGPLFLIPVT